MATNLGTLMATVGVDTRSLKKGLRDAEKETKASTSKMLSHWKAMAVGIVATFAIYKTAKLVKETALLAARFETLDIVMKTVGKNAGYSAAEMEEYDKALRKTGISMIESRNSLTRMAQAQLDLTKATQLGRIAQDAAVIGNINSSEAFQRLIYGIQSANLLVLRRIGINIQFEQSYKEVAKATNRTTASFTATEKALIRQNAVIAYGSRIAGTYEAAMTTAGKKLTSFVRYVEDFKVKMGLAFGPATVMLVDAATTAMKEFQEEISKPEAQEALRNLSSQLATMIIQLGQDLPKAVESITYAIAKLTSLLDSLSFSFYMMTNRVDKLYPKLDELTGKLFGIKKALVDLDALTYSFFAIEKLEEALKKVPFFMQAKLLEMGIKVGIEIDEEGINQFKKMQEMLTKGAPTRLDFALEDPDKYYGEMNFPEKLKRSKEYYANLEILAKDKRDFEQETEDEGTRMFVENLAYRFKMQGEYYKEIEAAAQEARDFEEELENEKIRMAEELSAYYAERLLLQNQFNQEYVDMGKSRFDLERDQVESLMEIYREAGFDKVKIAELTSHKLIAIAQAEQQAKLAIYQNIAGGIANTFQQIAQAGGRQSKEAFILYKAFAIVQATIAAHASIVGALGSPPYGVPAMILAGVIGAQAFMQIAMIAAAQPPSYDRGGISNAEGIYRTGNIAEAHIPLESGGTIPVRFDNKSGESEEPKEQVPINIINVNDPRQLDSYLASARGQDAILNVLGARSQSIRRILR